VFFITVPVLFLCSFRPNLLLGNPFLKTAHCVYVLRIFLGMEIKDLKRLSTVWVLNPELFRYNYV